MYDNSDLRLDEYAEYLLTRSLCKQYHTRFHVIWVRSNKSKLQMRAGQSTTVHPAIIGSFLRGTSPSEPCGRKILNPSFSTAVCCAQG